MRADRLWGRAPFVAELSSTAGEKASAIITTLPYASFHQFENRDSVLHVTKLNTAVTKIGPFIA